jgi:hypothetical protein
MVLLSAKPKMLLHIAKLTVKPYCLLPAKNIYHFLIPHSHSVHEADEAHGSHHYGAMHLALKSKRKRRNVNEGKGRGKGLAQIQDSGIKRVSYQVTSIDSLLPIDCQNH